jgi:hypothetical protein
VVSGFRTRGIGFARNAAFPPVLVVDDLITRKKFSFVLIVLPRRNVVSSKIYLAGAMERAGEYGAVWRDEITPHLETLGYRVWNPYKEELNTGITVPELAALKKADFAEYTRFCRRIVDYDIDNLLTCSIVACRVDAPTLKGAGTFGELTVCRMKGIPVYAWIDLPGGEYDVPAWAIGCLTKFSHTKEDFYASIPPARDLR